MKKEIKYWVGLPVVFVVLAGATFLIPKTYESHFTLAVESEQAVEHNRVMTLHRPENYDLGVIRTDNVMSNYAYKEIVRSDDFIRGLIEMDVRTMQGDWEGTYYDYCTKYKKREIRSGKPVAKHEGMPWVSEEEETVARELRNSIKVEVDYETELVTITCSSKDPLVSTMMAMSVREHLQEWIANYEQAKMEVALSQLHGLTETARKEWEEDGSKEKEEIYKSFQRQEVVYKAQMMYVPAFTMVSEPSFSYRKVAPSRWKWPLVITVLIGGCIWGWENREKLIELI